MPKLQEMCSNDDFKTTANALLAALYEADKIPRPFVSPSASVACLTLFQNNNQASNI